MAATSTMRRAAQPAPPLTADELQRAYLLCRCRGWPATLAEAMADERRAQLITACATGQRNKAARQARATAHGTPLPQAPLVPHWPPRRATPAMFDRKRAAAGDFDKD